MDAGWAREVETIERSVCEDMAAAAPSDFREAVGLRCERFGAAIALMAPKAPSTLFNRAFGFGADEDADEGELDEVIVTMRASGAPRWWLQPSRDDVARWIRERGFVEAPRPWSKMARGPAPATRVETPLIVTEIDRAHADAFSAIVCAGFDAPPIFGQWFTALIGRPGWRFYMARDHGKPVAGAALRIEGDTGWLGFAATAADARRRRAQGALIQRRIEDAVAARCRVIVTETGAKQADTPSPSYDNMMRQGFMVVHDRPNFAPPH